jgi:hypothetical protein
MTYGKKPKRPEMPEVPEWARVLDRPKLKLDKLSPEQLATELGERLSALIEAHHIDATTLEGWRELAVILAVNHHPSFQPAGPKLKRGKPKGISWDKWLTSFAVQSRRAKLERELDATKIANPKVKFDEKGLQKKAAKQIRREMHGAELAERRLKVQAGDPAPTVRNAPSVKRLENIVAEVKATSLPGGAIPVPPTRADQMFPVDRAMQQAAERITKRVK